MTGELRFESGNRYFEQTRNLRTKYLRYFTPGSTILDVGCGAGEFMLLLSSAGFRAIGVDIEEKAINRAREKELEVYRSDIFEFLLNNQRIYGGIYCSHFIEHMSPDKVKEFLTLAFQRLEPKGRIVFITPNPYFLSGMADFWIDPSHIRPYPPALLIKMLEGAGFTIIDKGEDMVQFRPSLNPLRFAINILRLVLSKLLMGGFYSGSEFFIVGEKSLN